MISPKQLIQIANINDPNTLNYLNNTLNKYSINTPLREQHFLAQVLYESGNLKIFKENLNYSAQGLVATFPHQFPNLTEATLYAHNPEKIADKVYATTDGNNVAGDGFKYIGRGAIQITGKANYAQLTKDLGVDFINNPQLLETMEYALLSAGWFWNMRKLNLIADANDIELITKRVNGGEEGLNGRIANFKKLETIII
jgi:putative chitinase